MGVNCGLESMNIHVIKACANGGSRTYRPISDHSSGEMLRDGKGDCAANYYVTCFRTYVNAHMFAHLDANRHRDRTLLLEREDEPGTRMMTESPLQWTSNG